MRTPSKSKAARAAGAKHVRPAKPLPAPPIVTKHDGASRCDCSRCIELDPSRDRFSKEVG